MGRRRKLVVEHYTDRPRCAYVTRLSPLRWRGRKLKVKVGRIDGIQDLDTDLEGVVMRRHGGHHFAARVYDQIDKKVFLGVHEFKLDADPLQDGKPIEPKPPKEKPPEIDEPDPEIEEIKRRRAERRRAERLRAEKRRERESQRRRESDRRLSAEVSELRADVARLREAVERSISEADEGR